MIEFKTDRLKTEFSELPQQNPRLLKTLEMFSLFCELEFKKNIVITCLYRSPADNRAVGGIVNSPHLTWEAVDLRSSTFTQAEIDKGVAFLNNLTFRNGKKTAMCHAVAGGAKHWHLQVRK